MALVDTPPSDTGGRGFSASELDRCMEPVEAARHAPGYVYSSPEIFQREKSRLFMKDWLCVGRVEEVENPGDYFTHNVMGEPIVIARAADGSLHAFYNMCAHRGAEVAEACGNVKWFICPYHAWTYDLSGQLIGAPFMKESKGFDAGRSRLKPLKLGIWAGWIFVSFNPKIEPLERFLAFFEAEFGFLKQEDCRLAYKFTIELDCNWKFVYENLLDMYHVGTTHAQTIGRLNQADSYKLNSAPRGRLSVHYRAGTMAPDGVTLMGKMPVLDGYPDDFARIGFMPPNMSYLVRCDYIRPFIHWPISPGRTRSIAYFLFPKEKFGAPDFDSKVQVYVDYLKDVLNEDIDMVQSLQRASSSAGFTPGRMSVMEGAIHHTLAYHLERVFGDAEAAAPHA